MIPHHFVSKFWRGVLKCRDSFLTGIRLECGSGETTRFCKDTWVGESTLVSMCLGFFASSFTRWSQWACFPCCKMLLYLPPRTKGYGDSQISYIWGMQVCEQRDASV